MQSARGFEYGVRHIISPQSGRLSDILLGILDILPAQVEFFLQLGSIYVEGQRTHLDLDIKEGSYIRVHSKPRRFLPDDGQWHNRTLFEDENFVVVRKVSGLPVHASVDNVLENVQSYAQKALGVPLLLTHRLDVPTRGLLVYAKTTAFQTGFNKLLIDRGMQKIYCAQVHGSDIPLGLMTHYMEPSPRAPKNVSVLRQDGWQECQLNVLNSFKVSPVRSEVRIELLTGRTHQIRAQMSKAGFPIVGDVAYGAPREWSEDRIELEARELAFVNPLTGEAHHFKG